MSFFSLSSRKSHYRNGHYGSGHYKKGGLLGNLFDILGSRSRSGRYYDPYGNPYPNMPPNSPYATPYPSPGTPLQQHAPLSQQYNQPLSQQHNAPPSHANMPAARPDRSLSANPGAQAPHTAMVCEDCRASIPAGSKFCLNCGKKVKESLFCTNCGENLPSNAKFCLKCGSKV